MKFWPALKRIFRQIMNRLKDPVFLTCLLIAALFLFLNKLDGTYVTDVTVPVTVEGVEIDRSGDQDLKIEKNVVDVGCRIRGKGYHLLKARFARVTLPSDRFVTVRDSDNYEVDMSAFETLLANELKDVELLRVYNKGIPLKSVVRFRKEVPVRSRISLDISGQYMQVGTTFLEPATVWISGSKRDIANIHSVSTREFRIVDAERQTAGNIGLEPIPNVEMSEKEVFYSVDVERYTEYRQENIEVQVRGYGKYEEYIVIPETISVTYNMAKEAYKNGVENGIVYYVDITDREMKGKNSTYMGDNTYLIRHTPLPVGVEIRKMSSDRAKVLRIK